MQRSSRAKRILLVTAGVALVLAVWLGIRSFWPRVQAVEVRAAPLVQLEVMSGRVRSPGVATLAAEVAGRVLEVPVDDGQQVAQGTLLVALEDSELRAEQLRASGALAQARAQLAQVSRVTSRVADASQEQAIADLERARLNFERAKTLTEGGALAQSQLDDARVAYEVARSRAESASLQASSSGPGGSERALAQAAVVQAEAALFAAQSRLEHARVLAPADGTVLRRLVEPGDSVQPGTGVVAFARTAAIELEADPDERSLAHLEAGQPARVSADAFPQRGFEATLRYIAPAVDPERGTVTVRFGVPQPPPFLRPDMTVSISVETGRREQALVLPSGAVREADSAKPWVLAVREGRTTRVEVKTGLQGEGTVEITEGLRAGDLVIPASASIGEGRRVRAGT